MKLNVPHHTTRAEAKKKVRNLLSNLAEEHSDVVSDVEESWSKDRLDFGFRARGFKAKGNLEVTDDEIVLEGKLPLLAKPFEPKIKSVIEREAKKIFRRKA